MFDRNLSVAYAAEYAYKYNPAYYNFSPLGGDCTNFVSQCLHAGGIPMNYFLNGWFYRNLNSRAPAWTGVNEFWTFGVNNKGAGVKLTPCIKNELEIADIIQLGNGSRFYHSLIVTKIIETENGKVIYVSAHDGNAFNAPLNGYAFHEMRCAKVSE